MLNVFFKKINGSDISKILRNSGWLIFDKIVKMIAGLLVGAWVARYLGPKDFGFLSYTLALLAFFQAVANLGLDGILVRDISKSINISGKLIGTALIIRICAGICCWLAAIIFVALINGIDSFDVQVIAIAGSFIVFQSTDVIDLWFQSQSQSKRTVKIKILSYIISNVLRVIIILSNGPLISFFIIIAIESAITSLFMYFSYQKYTCGYHLKFSKQIAIKLISESWPFILSGISIMIYMRIDQIMIKNMIGDEALGVFSAVSTIGSLWQFIPIVLATSFAPFISRKKTVSEEDYYKSLVMIFRLFSFLAWCVCIITLCFSSFIMDLLYGKEYASGISSLSIYVFTNLFIYLGVAQNLWILNEYKPKISLYKSLCGAICCVALNFMLIPNYGIQGAAVSAVLSQAISGVFCNLFLCPKVFSIQIKSLFFLPIKY